MKWQKPQYIRQENNKFKRIVPFILLITVFFVIFNFLLGLYEYQKIDLTETITAEIQKEYKVLSTLQTKDDVLLVCQSKDNNDIVVLYVQKYLFSFEKSCTILFDNHLLLLHDFEKVTYRLHNSQLEKINIAKNASRCLFGETSWFIDNNFIGCNVTQTTITFTVNDANADINELISTINIIKN